MIVNHKELGGRVYVGAHEACLSLTFCLVADRWCHSAGRVVFSLRCSPAAVGTVGAAVELPFCRGAAIFSIAVGHFEVW